MKELKIPAVFYILVTGFLIVTPALLAQEANQRKSTVDIEYTTASYEFGGDQNRLILQGPIKIQTDTLLVICDKAEILSSRQSKNTSSDPTQNTQLGTIDYILATGNVDIQQMGTQALAGKAEIFPTERKLVLEDNPRIIDEYGTVSGFRIVFLQGEREIKIEPDPAGSVNRIQLNDINEIDFLMGNEKPATGEPAEE